MYDFRNCIKKICNIFNFIFPPFQKELWEHVKMADRVEDDEHTIAEDLVVTKYKMAADIVNGERTVDKEYFHILLKNIDSVCL